MANSPTDDEARARWLKLTGGQPEDVGAMPIKEVHALLAAVDAQLDDYVALGLMTPAEADAF
ncbi:MAG: hypothetical protein K2X46_07995 [Roseomonas sp.]|nr:hypothetical protein [Roseomonas sp.]